MESGKKLKSRRGMTLAEVLIVVAIMVILLGVAMPNLLAESQAIKLAAMNGYARSVAVSVQSRLYGMKNSGTADGSEYETLNSETATNITLTTDGKTEALKCVSNFGDRGTEGRQKLLSGAITETEILQNGKIAVLYNPETANVILTYYSENEFDITSLLGADDTYRKSNLIGLYRGKNAPAPDVRPELPKPVLDVKNGEELLVDVKFADINPKLRDTNVVLEFYVASAKYPNQKALIYSEGTDAAKPIYLGDLDGKTLSLALDSYVLSRLSPLDLRGYADCFQPTATAVSLRNSDISLYPRQQLNE